MNHWLVCCAIVLGALLSAGCEEEEDTGANSLTGKNEGSSIAPLDITAQLPYNGSVGTGSSYYVIKGLTSGASTTVNMTLLSGINYLKLYSDPLFSVELCAETTDSTADKTCTGNANASGEIYIRVVNVEGGVITFTLDMSAAPPPAPGAPTGVSATAGTSQVTISWTDGTDATIHNIYWNTTGAPTTADTKIAGVTSPHVHSGLDSTLTYYYLVEAENVSGTATAGVVSAQPIPPPSTSLPDPGPVTAGVFPTNPDPFEAGSGDNTPADAAVNNAITFPAGSQAHSLYPAGDEDWVQVTVPTAGTTIEISVNNLSLRADTYLELYQSDGTTLIGSNDDYISWDSRLTYLTVVANEVLYVRVYRSPAAGAPDDALVMTYNLDIHALVDNDGDTYSNWYDCDDTLATGTSVYPFAPYTPDDGIDQDCDGSDEYGAATVDLHEPDDVFSSAKPLKASTGSVREIQLRPETWGDNGRTLHLAGNVDWVKFILPPFGAAYVETLFDNVSGLQTEGQLYDSDGATPIGVPSTWFEITNSTAATKEFFLQVYEFNASGTGYYAYFLEILGSDADGDGYYTIGGAPGWGGGNGWDCDDTDPAIYAGAPGEVVNDGHDTNCNGDDNT